MERCDFASVIAILRENLIDGSFANQVGFASALFEGYVQENETYFDNGLLNKWFNGLAKVSPGIGKYYLDDPKHRCELAETLRDRILTCMADSAMAVRKVHALLLQDDSISDEKKTALCGRLCSEGGDDAGFLADVLIFGIIRRPFVARDIRKSSLLPAETSATFLCVQSPGGASPCSLHCRKAHEKSSPRDAFAENFSGLPRGVSNPGSSESMIRIVWDVAHLNDWEDFRRGIVLLCDMERVFTQEKDHALLRALASMLRTMSCLRSSVKDYAQAAMEHDRAKYVHLVAGCDLSLRLGRGERAGWRDYTKPKSNRGPPAQQCTASSSCHFHKTVSVERRTACAP